MKNKYIAITLKILSVIFFVLMDVLIKKLSTDFSTFHIVFFRCFFGLFPVLVMMYITKSSLKTSKIYLHFLRATIACLAMFSFFKAFGILPLADVSSISFASIMIITILAIFILGEKVGVRRWIAIFFGFTGVLIVFRPGTSLFSYFSLLPLLGAFALSFASHDLSSRVGGKKKSYVRVKRQLGTAWQRIAQDAARSDLALQEEGPRQGADGTRNMKRMVKRRAGDAWEVAESGRGLGEVAERSS